MIGLSVLLLIAAFRSLWIPLVSAVFNLLSVGAAYGVVVAVFQEGVGASLIGVDSGVPIVSFIPVMLFAILFGLSMDYNVFLLSRIHEAYNEGDGPRESVVHGMARIGKVILFAGLIMAAVFLAFVTQPDVIAKMMGLGLGLAILIDVLIVRLVIAPAVVTLLGDRAWWLPRWLDRVLPNVSLEGHLVQGLDEKPAAPSGRRSPPRRDQHRERGEPRERPQQRLVADQTDAHAAHGDRAGRPRRRGDRPPSPPAIAPYSCDPVAVGDHRRAGEDRHPAPHPQHHHPGQHRKRAVDADDHPRCRPRSGRTPRRASREAGSDRTAAVPGICARAHQPDREGREPGAVAALEQERDRLHDHRERRERGEEERGREEPERCRAQDLLGVFAGHFPSAAAAPRPPRRSTIACSGTVTDGEDHRQDRGARRASHGRRSAPARAAGR